jgi:3-methyladenine DNA glycosylase AlkC
MNTEENSTPSFDWRTEVLVKLSKNEDRFVRRRVAENPNTPVDTLVTLSTDGSKFVRRGVANNPNAPTSNA